MAFDIEQFFQSIDIILTQRLSNLAYDTTIIATIIDDKDKARGHYVVSDGTIKFDAYTNDIGYKIDDQVRVAILNGDWSQKKFIEGKYTEGEGDGVSSIPYIPPLGTVMQDNQSTLNIIDDFVLYANYSNIRPLWSKKITTDSEFYALQANGIYNTITLQGDFQTELNSSEIASGNYGLLLELFIQPELDSNTRIRKYITFDSSEMIGNPYSYVIDSHQAKQIPITGSGIVTEIILSAYQAREFDADENGNYDLDNSGKLLGKTVPFKLRDGSDLIGEKNKNSIWFKNLTIGFGSDLTKVEDNSLKLYTTSSSTYHYAEGAGDLTNDKNLGVVWYNKSDLNGYIGFSDGIINLDNDNNIIHYDEIEYNKLSYADSRLMAQKGKGNVPTDEISLNLAAKYAESESSMIEACKALTTDLAEVLQQLGYRITGTTLNKNLNELITITDGKDAILVQKQKEAEEAFLKFSEMCSGILKYGYNIQNDTGEAKWESEWDTSNYYNDYQTAFNQAFDEVNTFLNLMDESTQPGKTLAGYRGIYNGFNPKVKKAIIAIQSTLAKITFVDTDINLLKSYKNKSEYVEYGATDLSDYDNKYSIYWYRYKEGYKLDLITPMSQKEWNNNKTEHKTYKEYQDYCNNNNEEYKYANFLGPGWERVHYSSDIFSESEWNKLDSKKYSTYNEYLAAQKLKNFGVPTSIGETIDGITYYPKSPLSAQILYRRMDPRAPEERYQVVLFYNHEMIKSNVVVFTNTEADKIPNEFLVDANDSLRIEHGADSKDHYQAYTSAFDLVNIRDESLGRQLRVSYDGVLVGDEALADADIYWYVPTINTMLTVDIDYLVNKLGFSSDGVSSLTLTLTGEKNKKTYTYIEDIEDSFQLIGSYIGTSDIIVQSWDKKKKTITLNKSLGALNKSAETLQNVINKTPYSRNGYIYFYKKIKYSEEYIDATDIDGNVILGANGVPVKDKKIIISEADRHFSYKIRRMFDRDNQNNTIYVKAYINGSRGQQKITEGDITMTFSTFGTNGTKYTFRLIPATNQTAILPDKKPNDDVIDGSLDLILSLKNANEELIPMTTNALSEGEDLMYSLSVDWHATPTDSANASGGINLTPVEGSKEWNVNVAMSNNNYKYMGIVSANVQYNAQGKTEIDKRVVKLSYLYPVAYSSDINYMFSGPIDIIYDSQGTVSRFNDEPLTLYSKYVNTGKQDVAGNTIFEENVKVEGQKWELQYFTDKGVLVNENDETVLAYMPKLNKDNTITPAPMYFDYSGKDASFYVPVAICKVGDDIVWTQPIVITQNRYESSTLNEWNGKFKIDEENGTILSTMVGAGRKTENNTFEGVLMGDIEAGANFNGNGIGMYGFNDGAQSFYFGVDGTAFIGKAGRGRIYFDGNEGKIQSASYNNNATSESGMVIDLDDGYIEMKGSTAFTTTDWKNLIKAQGNGTSYLGYTDYNEFVKRYGKLYKSDDTSSLIRMDVKNPYFIIQSDDGNKLLYIGKEDYYLQTNNFSTKTKEGTRIDLSEGSITSYNFSLKAEDKDGSYIQMNSDGNPFLKINYKGKKDLMSISSSEFVLRSHSWSEGTAGTKIDLINGTIESYSLNLYGIKTIGDKKYFISLNSTKDSVYPFNVNDNLMVDWYGNLTSLGNLTISGTATIGGETTISSNAIISGNLSVTGSISSSGAVNGNKYYSLGSNGATIGGWTITTNCIQNGSTYLYSGGKLILKSGTHEFSIGTDTKHPYASGLNIGAGGIVMNGTNGIGNCPNIGNDKSVITIGSGGTISTGAYFQIDGGTGYLYLGKGEKRRTLSEYVNDTCESYLKNYATTDYVDEQIEDAKNWWQKMLDGIIGG